jgi:hypothetical protein
MEGIEEAVSWHAAGAVAESKKPQNFANYRRRIKDLHWYEVENQGFQG